MTPTWAVGQVPLRVVLVVAVLVALALARQVRRKQRERPDARVRAPSPGHDRVHRLRLSARGAGSSWRGPRRPDPGLPLALDLAAAVLRCGSSVPDAICHGAAALSGATRREFDGVASLLRLGASPDEAWAGARTGGLATVAPTAVRSAVSGVKLAVAFDRAAQQLREARATDAAARAQRAGVHAMGPLAACFLPAFVCLGIVPVVVGVARTVFATLR